MKERPILFSAPMVRAILEGRKTQTRRVIKPFNSPCPAASVHPTKSNDGYIGWWPDPVSAEDTAEAYFDGGLKCPYGAIGDRLWVRETWQGFHQTSIEYDEWEEMESTKDRFWKHYEPVYKADNKNFPNRWLSPIHMPREFSRITLEITNVRVERLKNISGPDCAAEGIQFRGINDGPTIERGVGLWKETKMHYRKLWECINGKGSWDANPWVWVIEFKRVMP